MKLTFLRCRLAGGIVNFACDFRCSGQVVDERLLPAIGNGEYVDLLDDGCVLARMIGNDVSLLVEGNCRGPGTDRNSEQRQASATHAVAWRGFAMRRHEVSSEGTGDRCRPGTFRHQMASASREWMSIGGYLSGSSRVEGAFKTHIRWRSGSFRAMHHPNFVRATMDRDEP